MVGGGAPIDIPTWRYLDVDTLYFDPERMDARTIEAAGGAFPYDRLRKQPVDGTFLAAGTGWDPDGPSGRTQTFWIHDGAAIPVKDQNACEPFYQNAPMAVTDISAVEKAGTGGFYDHLATLPADHPEPPC